MPAPSVAEVQAGPSARAEEAAPAHHRLPAPRARHAADLTRMPTWALDPVLHPSGAGRALEPGLRGRAERSLGTDLGRVRVHDDGLSQQATSGLGAVAVTRGTDVFLGVGAPDPASARGRALLRHELTHVGEQADAPSDAPVVQCQHRRATSSADVDEIREAMDSATDAGASGHAALDLLREYELADAVEILVQLDAEQRVETIAGVLTMADTDPLVGAIFAVLYLSQNHRPTQSWAILAARILAGLPDAERTALLVQVLRLSGRADEVEMLQEGTSAFTESETALASTPDTVVDDDAAAAAVAPTMSGVTPGPWNPGRMPIPFYLGNAAHIGIAAAYVAAHPGQSVFTNTISVSAIVAAARRMGLAVGAATTATRGQLDMEPDIANLSLLHLFEIKPTTLQSLGAAEAALYVAAFAAAGLPVALGSSSEPGTSGVVPAPGGWYEYRSPQPGVITYNYRQPPRVRVRVRVRAPARAPSRSTSRSSSKSFMETMQELTGLTGTALIIYIIISEGSRAFPPRNLVPVP